MQKLKDLENSERRKFSGVVVREKVFRFESFKEVANARVSGSQDQPRPDAVFQPPQGGGGLEPDHWL